MLVRHTILCGGIDGLLEKLRRYGVQEEFVGWCEALYEEVEGIVLMDCEQSRWFSVEEGLHQGCPLSPLLYSIYMYVVGKVEELEKVGIGVKVDGMWCGALLYADDIVLIAKSGAELLTSDITCGG